MLWVNLIMDVLAAISLGAEKPSKSNDRISRNDYLLKPEMYRSIICMSLYQILVMVILMYFGGLMFFNNSINLITSPIRDPTTQEPTDRMKLNTILFNTFILMNLLNQINCKCSKFEASKLFTNRVFWTNLIAELGLQSLLLMVGTTDLGQAVLGITSITPG